MSFVDGSERIIENSEETLSGAASGVEPVECFPLKFTKRQVLDHYHQDSHGQAVDISRGHLVRSSCFSLCGPVSAGASVMIDTRTNLLSVA